MSLHVVKSSIVRSLQLACISLLSFSASSLAQDLTWYRGMQAYSDLFWLDIRLEKLKLYLDDLKSHFIHIELHYGNLRPRLPDVERQLEYVRPWIDDFRPSFRGLEPRARTIRSLIQKLLVCSLIALFIGSWWRFLRGGRSSLLSRSPETDHSVSNTTLGVCVPAMALYWELADRW